MKNERLALEEKMLGEILRNELMKVSEPEKEITKQENFSNVEFIAKNVVQEAPIQEIEEESPIMRMNEDQVLNFVEMLDPNTLSALSVKELNYIGEVLGVEPQILFGMECLED